MAKFCCTCGRIIPDLAMQCPQCGSMQAADPIPRTPAAGYRTPYPEIQCIDNFTPPPVQPPYVQQTDKVLSPAGWFGWLLVLGFLQVFGALIMYHKVTDASAKNFAKLAIVMYCLLIVFGMLAGFFLMFTQFLSIF